MTFQDPLFSSQREVCRVLESGITLYLLLEPLPDERVQIIRYERQRSGKSRERDKAEEGRIMAYKQLGLPCGFTDLFGDAPLT